MKIKKIKIYTNDNELSKSTKKELETKLLANGFILDQINPDLVIAIGGDGTFLRMVKDNKYDNKKYYVGINCGTLGFLQNINPDEIDIFLKRIKEENYILEEISIQETEVITAKENRVFYALNEILIRSKDLDTINLEVNIDNEFLENYVGDGLLISTSTGSTAYNLSFGGSIVFNTFPAMQITPIAPLNSNAYRNIINSIIIPEEMLISLKPINDKDGILLTVDGVNHTLIKVKDIRVNCKTRKIKCLRLNEYHFIKTINDKFIK